VFVIGKHKTIGGIEFTASRGLTFKKKPSETNYCVAREMKDKSYKDRGAVQKAFVKALDTCGVKLKPATKKKWGITATKKA